MMPLAQESNQQYEHDAQHQFPGGAQSSADCKKS